MEPAIRKAFEDAIAHMISVAQVGLLEDAIAAGDIQRVLNVLQIGPSFFAPLDRAMGEALWQSGTATIAGLPKLRDPFSGQRVVIGFDGRHPRAEEWARGRAGNLITGIVDDQLVMVRAALTEAVMTSQPPRSAALEIVGRVNRATGIREGGLLGLTSQQAGYVRNLRGELADPATMANYLTRERRYRRFDKLVRDAMASGKPVAQADIDRIAASYGNRLLKLRGDTIAQNESITAMRAGQHEGYRQLVESGQVRDSQITRTWSATPDTFTRHDHMVMNGQTLTGVQANWTLPDGSQMRFPGDVSLGARAAETIGCRCHEQFRIRFI